MQTFLPYASYELSAKVLDDKRLGKQRVETLQIMGALITRVGWVNHPATKMWLGYEYSLLEYQYAICWEWHINRGYKDTCLQKTSEMFWRAPYLFEDHSDPYWLGDEEFHLAHQSNLLRKNPEFYSQFDWDCGFDRPYVWPSHF